MEKIANNCTTKIIGNVDCIISKVNNNSDIRCDNYYSQIIENLFRISWRSTEIPVEFRFAKNSPLTEKTWIILDYLSNALVQLGDNIILERALIDNILDDLKNLRTALNNNSSANTNKPINLPNLEKFVSFFHDRYLLGQLVNYLKKIDDAKVDESFSEFVKDEQVCYAIFRVLEVFGEVFKNLRDDAFSDNSSIRTAFRDFRNTIHHRRFFMEIIGKHRKDVISQLAEKMWNLLVPLNVLIDDFNSYNLDSFDSFITWNEQAKSKYAVFLSDKNLSFIKESLNTLDLSKTQRGLQKFFKTIADEDKFILEKVILKLDSNANPIDGEEDLTRVINCLNGSYEDKVMELIKDTIWRAYHKIPIDDYKQIKKYIEQSRQSLNVTEFKKRLTERLINPNEEARMNIISYNEILNTFKKIKFSSYKDEQNLKNIVEAHVMTKDKYLQLLNIEKVRSVCRAITLTPEKRLKYNGGTNTLDIKEKVYLRYFMEAQPNLVQTFMDNFTGLNDPADIFEEITRTEQLRKYDEKELKVLGQKLLFNHLTRKYDYTKIGSKAREKDFKKTEEELKIFSNIFSNLRQPTQSTNSTKNASVGKPNTTVNKIIRNIEKLERTLAGLDDGNTRQSYKEMMKLSAQYMLEEIGRLSGNYVELTKSDDTLPLSISRRQFLILNAARKAMAHHPIHIDDEKLEFYVEQLVLDSQLRLQQLGNQTFRSDVDNLVDFGKRREIDIRQVKENVDLIEYLIMGSGFSSNIIVFNEKLDCDIGVQSDLIFVVIPSKETQHSVVELELELSYKLNCDVKIYTQCSLQQSNKLTKNHQTQVLSIESLTHFLVSKSFEHIYDDNTWMQCRLPNSAVIYNNRKGVIPKEQFRTAVEVACVFKQQFKNEQTEEITCLRFNRIKYIPEISDIINGKALAYSQSLCKVLENIKRNVELRVFQKLLDIVIISKIIMRSLWDFFDDNEYGIKKNFPALATVNKIGFRNHFYNQIEEFTKAFPKLSNIEELKKRQEALFASLDRLEQNSFSILNVALSRLVGFGIVKHIQNNIGHFAIENNSWLILPAVLTNLRGCYCIVQDISKIWLKETLARPEMKDGLQMHGYLLENNESHKEIREDYLILDFSSEVEFAYVQLINQRLEAIRGTDLILANRIIDEDVSLIEEVENFNSDDKTLENTDFKYETPLISNGIIGFGSELDRHLMLLHEQFAGGYVGCKAYEPNLFIENFIDRAGELGQEGNLIAQINRIDTIYRLNESIYTLKQLLQFYKSSCSLESFDDKDKKILEYYYCFKYFKAKFNEILYRLDKNSKKVENIKHLISINCNPSSKAKQESKLKNLEKHISSDVDQLNKIIQDIYDSNYIKRRIVKVLQNPFRLQDILRFVECKPPEKHNDLFTLSIRSAILKIKYSILKELIIDVEMCNCDNKLISYLIAFCPAKYLQSKINTRTLGACIKSKPTSISINKSSQYYHF